MEGPRTDAGIPIRPAAGQGINPDEAIDSIRDALDSVQAPAATAAPAVPASVAAEPAPTAPTEPTEPTAPTAPTAPVAPVDPVTAPISADEFIEQSPGGEGVPEPQVISATPQEGLVPAKDPSTGRLVYVDENTATQMFETNRAQEIARQEAAQRAAQSPEMQAITEGNLNRVIQEARQREAERAASMPITGEKQASDSPNAGRRYTDAQLRDMFPNKEDRKRAKALDQAGFDPLGKGRYQDMEAERARKAEDERRRDELLEIRKRQQEQTARNEFDKANQAAENTARAEGLQPGTPEYTARVNELRGITLYGSEYIPPATPANGKASYTAEQAKEFGFPYFETMEAYEAADEAGNLSQLPDGQKVIVAGQVETHRKPQKQQKKQRQPRRRQNNTQA